MNFEALNPHKLSTEGIDLSQAATLYKEFFISKDYNWWYEVLPGDIVVDVGSCVGFFAAQALDHGADRVYMIEPNKDLLKTGIRNVSDYIIEDSTKVVPIHGAIAEEDGDTLHVFGDSDDSYPTFSFQQFLETHKIETIDFLKLDCEGAEYNIFKSMPPKFWQENVRHVAVEIHLRANVNSGKQWIELRDGLLKHLVENGKVKTQFGRNGNHGIFKDDWAILNQDFTRVPSEFMLYITNW